MDQTFTFQSPKTFFGNRSLINREEYAPVFVKFQGKYACDTDRRPILFASKVYAIHWLVFAGMPLEDADQLEFESAV